MRHLSRALRLPRAVRAFGRNPLVRSSDRVEAIVVLLALLFCTLAVPVVGTVGASTHDSLAWTYAEQARERHTVTAEAVGDSTPTKGLHNAVEARWSDGGRVHQETITHREVVSAGDEFEIWVDAAGERVDAPVPVGRAAVDAVLIAVIALAGICATAAATSALVVAALNKRRDGQWTRSLASLLGEERNPKDRA